MRYASPVLCCLLLFASVQTANAQSGTTYTDITTFNIISQNLGLKNPQTINFDAATVGSAVNSSVTFNSSSSSTTAMVINGSTNLTVQSGNSTSSGSNYLGGATTGVIIPHTTTITFTPTDKPLSAFGLTLMSTGSETITLTATTTTGGTYVATGNTAFDTSGPNYYFIGFTDSKFGYSSVVLSVTGSDYWVDDIRYTAAPELPFMIGIAAVVLLTLKGLLGRVGLGIL